MPTSSRHRPDAFALSRRRRLAAAVAAAAALLASRPAGATLQVVLAQGQLTADGVPPVASVAAPLLDTTNPDLWIVRLAGEASADRQGGLCYEGGFLYLATLGGEAVLRHGVASGALELGADVHPAELPLKSERPFECSQLISGLSNRWGAWGNGRLRLRFTDTATVVADGLAPGTPVSLPVTIAIQSAVSITGRPQGIDTSALATFEGLVLDTTVSSQNHIAFLSGAQRSRGVVETAVGRQLEIRGQLDLAVAAVGGGNGSDFSFYTSVQASAAVDYAGLSIGVPPGVTLTTASGADYTVPVPGPGAVAAGAAALLGLLLVQGRGRSARTEPAIASTRRCRALDLDSRMPRDADL